MSQPFIVMCAPNGARKSKDDHGGIPISSDELADCAESICDAGASIMHVHVRDDDGAHTLDVARYQSAIDAIQARVGDQLIVQATTESCGIYTAEQQMQVVQELRPEAVSVALRELCPDASGESVAAGFFQWLCAEKIMVQHILYSPEEVRRFVTLCERGIIPDNHPFALFVLGRYSDDLTGDPGELDAFLDVSPGTLTWAVCCFGTTEQDAVRRAAGGGGHARVGFENNLQLPDGELAPDNSALVAIAVSNARKSGRTLATADDVRALFAD